MLWHQNSYVLHVMCIVFVACNVLIACVCYVCVIIRLILDVRLVDVPTGVTQDFSSTFLHRVLAFIFLARRIEPFLSLVDRVVEFCVLTFSTCWSFFFFFFFLFVKKKNNYRDSNSSPNVSEGFEVTD